MCNRARKVRVVGKPPCTTRQWSRVQSCCRITPNSTRIAIEFQGARRARVRARDRDAGADGFYSCNCWSLPEPAAATRQTKAPVGVSMPALEPRHDAASLNKSAILSLFTRILLRLAAHQTGGRGLYVSIGRLRLQRLEPGGADTIFAVFAELGKVRGLSIVCPR